jgi:hypothetical protein
VQNGDRLLTEDVAFARETEGMIAAIDKSGADPLLKRARAPRQRRLRDVANVCRTRKAARFRKTQEVFQPL